MTKGKRNKLLRVCWRRNGNAKCRKRLSSLAPYFSAKQKMSKMKFMFWIKLCQRVEMSSIASQCMVSRVTAFNGNVNF